METGIKKVILEIIFIFATVLIFRSLWTLLDKSSFMNSSEGLWLSLVLGVFVSLFMIYSIHRCDDNKGKIKTKKKTK